VNNKQSQDKPRRLMYHRDLSCWEWLQTPLKVEDFIGDFVGRIAGTQVDTFVLHMHYNLYPSRLTVEEYASENDTPVGVVGAHATWGSEEGLTASSWRLLENSKALWRMNVDPVATLIDAGHEVGIDFFGGIRMNDCHHAQWSWHPKFWIDHPEFRIGDHPEYHYPRPGFREPEGGAFGSQIDDRVPACLDYMHQEVRDYYLAMIEEAARVYDVQGIELDFTRHPFFFKPSEVEAGTDKMTELLAAVRDRLHTISEEKGREIVLDAKVPPTIEACEAIGLDVRRWLGEGLVDIMVVGPLWHPDFNLPIEDFVEAAEGSGAKIFASFELAEIPALENAEATAKVIRSSALAYWKAGAAGMHVFNSHVMTHYLRQEMPFLKDIGDPHLLEYCDKHYLATRASNYDNVVKFSYPKELPVTLVESPTGEGQKVHLKIGDDLEKAARLGITADARLRLRVVNLTTPDEIEFKFNGITLDPDDCERTFFPMGESQGLRQYSFLAEAYYGLEGPYHWLEFKLAGETLPRLGVNEVEVILRKRNPEVAEGVVLNDVELTIDYSQ